MTEPEIPTTAADQEKLKEIIDKDAKAGRSLSGFWYWLCSSLAVGMVLFYMYCAATPVDTQYFLGLYVMLTYVLIFLNYPFTSKAPKKLWYFIDSAIPFLTLFLIFYFAQHFLFGTKAPGTIHRRELIYAVVSVGAAVVFFVPTRYWGKDEGNAPIAMDLFLALGAIFAVGYYIVEYAAINYRMGSETSLDTAVSFLGILISLDVARRVLGWSMTLVGVSFLLYAFYGDLLHSVPVIDAFAHTGFKIDRTLNHIYLQTGGRLRHHGQRAGDLRDPVHLLRFLPEILRRQPLLSGSAHGAGRKGGGRSGQGGGAGLRFLRLGVGVGHRQYGFHRRLYHSPDEEGRFRPHVAGAIEPSASIGGMFMPPIMGAGGFIMAEMTEIPYVKIMLMAIFPAAIYFLSVFVMVHYEAKRYGLGAFGKKTHRPPG